MTDVAQMIIQTIGNGAFRDDACLKDEIFDLLSPSYEDPTTLLERELDHCDTLYVARDPSDRLMAFFLVAWEALTVNQATLKSVYLGLSATSQENKGSGIIRCLYERFRSDAYSWEKENQRRLLLWATTAAPSPYSAVNHLFDEVVPGADGSYSLWAAGVAQVLRRRYGLTSTDSGLNPFVLRAVAHNTRYSKSEVERINRIVEKNNFTLFRQLGIDERRGDRLLIICRVPDNHSGDRLSPSSLMKAG
jgi:hypothetical protein